MTANQKYVRMVFDVRYEWKTDDIIKPKGLSRNGI